MPLLSEQELAELRTVRAQQMTASGTVHRPGPATPQGTDIRMWPVHHTEAGLIGASRQLTQGVSRQLTQGVDGLLLQRDQPEWVTGVDSLTQAGDALMVAGRWFVVGAARTQTIQTAAVYPLTEVSYGA